MLFLLLLLHFLFFCVSASAIIMKFTLFFIFFFISHFLFRCHLTIITVRCDLRYQLEMFFGLIFFFSFFFYYLLLLCTVADTLLNYDAENVFGGHEYFIRFFLTPSHFFFLFPFSQSFQLFFLYSICHDSENRKKIWEYRQKLPFSWGRNMRTEKYALYLSEMTGGRRYA